MFLVATLYFGRATTAVRVRNMSATGALVEGVDLPPPGSAVILRRGALEAAGTAGWAEAGKAGLTFGEPVTVSAWLPTKETKRQTQIDEIAFTMKQAARSDHVAVDPTLGSDQSMATTIAELIAVQAQLGRLGDKLALDMVVLTTHPEVQLLDVAAQRIGRIVETIKVAKG